MSNKAFAPLSAGQASATPAGDEWRPILPIPADAPAPPRRHSKLGSPSSVWTYRDATGAALGFACRFDTKDGKEFLPLTWCMNTKTSKPAWRWKGLPEPRPLYQLNDLAKRPDAPVIVTEGEKAADAAAKLFPDHLATTSPNGSKSARKADWSALAGRKVIIWPDADEPGEAYAQAVGELCHAAGAASIAIIEPPAGLASGFDAADALTDGWDADQLSALISGAKRPKMSPAVSGADENAAQGAKSPKGRRKTQKHQIFDFVDDRFEFWHDPERENFVTYPVGNHFEHAPIRHRFFKNHVAGLFYEKTGGPLGAAALDDALRVMEALAQAGECHQTFRRVGQHGDEIYLDLGDDEWRSVKIAGHGWKVGQFPHVKFLRSNSARPLPTPAEGGSLQILKDYINVADPADMMLIQAWIVGR